MVARSGHLVALDRRDSTALMINPLSPWEHILLSWLPKLIHTASLESCILCETPAGAESFLVITFLWQVKYFAELGSLLVYMWNLGSQSNWTTNLQKISGAVLLNTCRSTWSMIFQHLPILLDFSCHGLLAWSTLLYLKVKINCSLLF